MPYITAELIEKTWRKVGAFEGYKINRLQKQHRKAQNPLTMFVYATLPVTREDAGALLIYVYHVVFEAFRYVEPRPKRVSKPQIEVVSQELTPTASFVLDQALDASPEPHVLLYVYEAFTEDDEDVTLSEEELDSFLGILQIVISCLHNACRRK